MDLFTSNDQYAGNFLLALMVVRCSNLTLCSHFGSLLYGDRRLLDNSWIFRFAQFQCPATNIVNQIDLLVELVLLASWEASGSDSGTELWESVAKGEFLTETHSSTKITEWYVVKEGGRNFTVKEAVKDILQKVDIPTLTTTSPLLQESADCFDTVFNVGAVASRTERPPLDVESCLNGCVMSRNVNWGDQMNRLRWMAENCRNFIAGAESTRRCLLFQALGGAVVCHSRIIPLEVEEFVRLNSSPERSIMRMDNILDVLVLSGIVLVKAYGDFRGGLLEESNRLCLPLKSVFRGYLSNILRFHEALTSDSQGIREEPDTKYDWFTGNWKDASSMRYQCQMFAVHLLFHSALHHVLKFNDVFGGPLNIQQYGGDVFRLEDAMEYASMCIISNEGKTSNATTELEVERERLVGSMLLCVLTNCSSC